MKAVYIGINTPGTTSRMRCEKIAQILDDWDMQVIDTDIPFLSGPKVLRSLAFRYKIGPVVSKINAYIKNEVRDNQYDLIWVDKAIYLDPNTTNLLRSCAKKLVHFTPDTAFLNNHSKHFNRSVGLYDHVITTKHFESQNYKALIDPARIIFATQGYDKDIHKPVCDFYEKENYVSFIGLCEPHREQVLQHLINSKIKIVLAGRGWEAFAKQNAGSPYLDFRGTELRDKEYSSAISKGFFSIGLLSKKFPEMHTTRTFEIPACGTALLTEKNAETESFFGTSDVIFYDNIHSLVENIGYYTRKMHELLQLTSNGTKKVQGLQVEYKQLLSSILNKVLNA